VVQFRVQACDVVFSRLACDAAAGCRIFEQRCLAFEPVLDAQLHPLCAAPGRLYLNGCVSSEPACHYLALMNVALRRRIFRGGATVYGVLQHFRT
jgi:hypothetical protein